MEIKKHTTASLEDAVQLKDDEVLVKLIPDYYAPRKSEGFSSHVQEDDLYNVGAIAAGHPTYTGNIIYFLKGGAPVINLTGYGKFHLVNLKHHMYLIRSDEKVENKFLTNKN